MEEIDARKAINRNLTFKPWWIQEYLRSPNHKTNYTYYQVHT
jgi:hypothetical protein